MMRIIVGLLAAVLLAACGGPVDTGAAIAKAEPATGAALENYSRNISEQVELAKDAPLVQLFCKQATGAACPADIEGRLAAYGYADKATGVDLANAFTGMLADSLDGNADRISTDEDFLAAAYRVVLARAPDLGGAQTNLKFIRETGQRQAMLRSMLESREFQAR